MTTGTRQSGTRGADYSSRTTPAMLAALKANGFDYAIRYVCGNPANPKTATRAEVEYLHRNGIGVLLVFERNAGRPLLGAIAGREDGKLAAADAIALGYPADCPMLFAVDLDVHAGNRSAVVSYWYAASAAYKAARGGTAQVGVYGDYDIIDELPASNLNWQANAEGWSWIKRLTTIIRRIHPAAHIHQKRTVAFYDPNDTLRPIRVWTSTTPTPEPPTPEDDDMAKLFQADDGDTAIFAVSGRTAAWVPSTANLNALSYAGLVKPGVNKCGRAFYRELVLVGPTPSYPADYKAKRTTGIDFGAVG